MIPDPEFFALCIRESFQEYLELANRLPAARRKGRPKKRAKSKAGGAKAKGKTAASRRKAA